jgi:hypothetical protein
LEDLGIVNGEFVTVRAMAAYRDSSGKVPLILIFSTDDLTTVKKVLVPIEDEAWWALGLVWTF